MAESLDSRTAVVASTPDYREDTRSTMDVGVVDWILGRAGFHRLLRQVVETVGPDKVLFGSDQMRRPDKIPIAVCAIQEASFLGEEDKAKILGGNARRLLS